jgi:acetolactate synthase-1/2/3 large subunit
LLNSRLIHVDSDTEYFRNSPMAQLHVLGDPTAIFQRVDTVVRTEMTSRNNNPVPRNKARTVLQLISESTARPAPNCALDEPAEWNSDAIPIKPQRLMRELSRRLPPTTRFVADAGNATAWVIHYLEARNNRRLGVVRPQVSGPAVIEAACGAPRPMEAVTERRRDRAGWLRVLTEFAPMGWAIGAAVGIASAKPECPVVCINGDGSYLMNGQEITVAAQLGLTVIFIVLNDAALGMVKHGQRLAGAERVAFELPVVDYAAMARSMGVAGHVIHGPEDFDALDMNAILNRQGPTLLDIRIDGEEVPPMDLRMQTLDAGAAA